MLAVCIFAKEDANLDIQTVAVGVIKSVAKTEKSGGKVTKAAQKATGKK